MQFIPYIYEPQRSIEVLKETETYLLANKPIQEKLQELGWVYHTIGQTIPQTYDNLWSGHFFPYMESWDELQIAFTLCCFGLYKQAFVSLRMGLELGILSVYYNINDEGHNTVVDWLNSKNTSDGLTPRSQKIWKILLSHPNIKAFNDRFNLRNRFEELGFLHDYVHSRGHRFSNKFGIPKSNFQTFELSMLKKWVEAYTSIIILITTMHLLKYPIAVIPYDYGKKFGVDVPSFGGLQQFQIEKIARLLPEGFMKELQEIASNDQETQKTMKWIKSLPDMTEEQIEEQIMELEKSSIKHGEGFNAWLERQKDTWKKFGEGEFSSTMRERVRKLRNWALENGYMEPKFNRRDE